MSLSLIAHETLRQCFLEIENVHELAKQQEESYARTLKL